MALKSSIKKTTVPGTGTSLTPPKHDFTQYLGPPIQAKSAQATVTSAKLDTVGSTVIPQQNKAMVVHPAIFTDGTSVTVNAGRTINLGNYESLRVDVSITMPCKVDTFEDTFDFASEWAGKKVNEVVKDAKGE